LFNAFLYLKAFIYNVSKQGITLEFFLSRTLHYDITLTTVTS